MTRHVFIVPLPDIGEGVVEGEVIEWLKNLGDHCQYNEPVVIVMTDKATVELPAPYPGKLNKIHFKAGQVAIKDKPLYEIILDKDVEVSKIDQELQDKLQGKPITAAPSVRNTAKKLLQDLSPHKTLSGDRALAKPPTRHLAKNLGIDINKISASGLKGEVTPKDLRTHLVQIAKTPTTEIPRFEGDTLIPLQGIRKLIAEKMTESKTTVPHFAFFDQANAKSLIKMCKKLKPHAESRQLQLTFMPFFIRALCLTLSRFPQCNASIDPVENVIVQHRPIHIGIAMKTALGLIVPVLKNADQMTLEELTKAYQDLKKRAKTNQLNPKEMKGSTATISNFGTEGGLWATPVINYPDALILGTARIHDQAIVRAGKILVRPLLNCSWSFDHRLIDGDLAAKFSKAFIEYLEHPSRLI